MTDRVPKLGVVPHPFIPAPGMHRQVDLSETGLIYIAGSKPVEATDGDPASKHSNKQECVRNLKEGGRSAVLSLKVW